MRDPAGWFPQTGVRANNFQDVPSDPVIPEKRQGQLKDFIVVRTQPRRFHVENDGSANRRYSFGQGVFPFI